MPKNKNASYRYRLIDQCLRQPRKIWKYDELLDFISEKLYEEFDVEGGISPRQLAEDIKNMRRLRPEGFDAPIERRKGLVYYTDPDYSFDRNPLIESDVNSLKEALLILKQFSHLPHYSELSNVISKLEGTINQGTESRSIIQFESNPDVQGLDWIPKLTDFISNKSPINIEYRSFKAEESKSEIVHPYLLKEYRNRWFLIGHNESFEGISIYALDRIQGIMETGGKYIENSIFDPDHYFDKVIGVSIAPEQEPIRIQLKVSKKSSMYILTKPLHHSQKLIKETKDFIIIEINVIPNFEFESRILELGENIEVIGPIQTRESISRRLKESLDAYIDTKT